MYNYIFPFNEIGIGSKVVIYGAGEIGQEYYSQIRTIEYCSIVAWSDIKFGENDSDFWIAPYKLSTICFDYIVIAIFEKNIRDDVVKYLCKIGISKSKIITSIREAHKVKLLGDLNKVGNRTEDYLHLLETFFLKNQQFGEGYFYQSFDLLDIRGQRPTAERIRKYNLLKYIDKKHLVLDVGCNCGFFDLQISEYIKEIDGVEYNASLVDVANTMKKIMDINNVNFFSIDFKEYLTEKKYDFIFLFSVICWLGMDLINLADKIMSINADNGYILVESHNIEDGIRYSNYEKFVNYIREKGYVIVETGMIFDDKKIRREFMLLKRN